MFCLFAKPPLPEERDYIKFECYLLRPIGEEFRVIKDNSYQSWHEFDLETKVNGEWQIVTQWDNGWDEHGPLSAARWRRVGEMGGWDEGSILRYMRRLSIHLGLAERERTVVG